MLEEESWLPKGRHGGKSIERAHAALSAAHASASLSIDLLDSVFGHEHLGVNLMARALIEDVKLGRIGVQCGEERDAIAANTVEEFTEGWPAMRDRLRENWLVSLASALEIYVRSLLAEFPNPEYHFDPEPADSDVESTQEWQAADRDYRKTVKAKDSTAAAWVKLIGRSSVPESVKTSVAQWGVSVDAQMIDEMVLVRNDIVHRAGRVGKKLSTHVHLLAHHRVNLTKAHMNHYSRAYWGFVVSIDPSF